MSVAKRLSLPGVIKQIDKNSRSKREPHIVVHNIDFIHVIPVKDISYAQAQSNYTGFHIKGGEFILSSKTMRTYENTLKYSGFIKPHKSFWTNPNQVCKIQKNPKYQLILKSGEEIPIARSKQKTIISYFTHQYPHGQ